MHGRLVHVLAEDPELCAGLDGTRMHRARRELVAATVAVGRRRAIPDEPATSAGSGVGLLILEGLVVRRAGGDGHFGAELLGRRDVLRPWQHDGEDEGLPFTTSFVVVEPALLAILDAAFVAHLEPYPEVVGQLAGRAMARSRNLAIQTGIASYPRVDRRLHLLLWHLAERWGRVTPDGVRLALPLSHGVLADLIAVRRPSVTAGLAQLERDGLVTRAETGWILHGELPHEFDRPRADGLAPNRSWP
jgi:CRP/FNR family transcriptional regulator, cyclic AMP receptor protein